MIEYENLDIYCVTNKRLPFLEDFNCFVSESKTIVLPEIKRPRPAVSVREGSTVPVFDIIAQSSSRYATVVALGLEEMV